MQRYFLAAMLLWLSATSVARAQDVELPSAVVLAPLHGSESLLAAHGAEVLAAIRDGLERMQIEVVNVPAGCDEDCVAEHLRDSAATLVVHLALWEHAGRGQHSGGTELSITLLEGADQYSARRRIDEQGAAAVTQRVLALAFINRVQTHVVTVTITTEPPGAAVAIHGAPEGQSPVQVELHSGPYRFTASLDGYADTFEDMDIDAEHTQVTLTLQPTAAGHLNSDVDSDVEPGGDGGNEERSGTHWQSIAGPAMLVGGLAGAAAVWVGAAVAEQAEPPVGRQNNLAIGPTLGWTGLGLAVAGAGLVLWLTAPESPTQIAISPTQLTVSQSF